MSSSKRIFVLLITTLIILTTCTTTPTPSNTPTSSPPATATHIPTSTTTSTQVPAPTYTPTSTEIVFDSPVREITVLYTNDEQGWMEGVEEGRGAANMVGVWQKKHGYSPDGPFLILSGGDMWTGAAISTWYEGESMVNVMNSMHYSAAALGNHEFDFGLDVLAERSSQMDFPLLSANMYYRSDGSRPTDLGISPYTIKEVNGIRIAIIGLTTTITPTITFPKYVGGFVFEEYWEALEKIVPEVKLAGADLILVPAHVCLEELNSLARVAGELGVHLLGGGHCEELSSSIVNHIVILEGGHNMETYAYATFSVDVEEGTVKIISHGTDFNYDGATDPSIKEVVDIWREKSDAEINIAIGYSQNGMDITSPVLRKIIVESWLVEFPNADIALCNLGGIRDSLKPGEITISDIISILPFDNAIVQIELSGRDIQNILAERGDNFAIGGLTRHAGRWEFRKNGEPLDSNDRYIVLVNDYMYEGSYTFRGLDPNGYYLSINYRQPLINWVIDQASDIDHPLEDFLNALTE